MPSAVRAIAPATTNAASAVAMAESICAGGRAARRAVRAVLAALARIAPQPEVAGSPTAHRLNLPSSPPALRPADEPLAPSTRAISRAHFPALRAWLCRHATAAAAAASGTPFASPPCACAAHAARRRHRPAFPACARTAAAPHERARALADHPRGIPRTRAQKRPLSPLFAASPWNRACRLNGAPKQATRIKISPIHIGGNDNDTEPSHNQINEVTAQARLESFIRQIEWMWISLFVLTYLLRGRESCASCAGENKAPLGKKGASLRARRVGPPPLSHPRVSAPRECQTRSIDRCQRRHFAVFGGVVPSPRHVARRRRAPLIACES